MDLDEWEYLSDDDGNRNGKRLNSRLYENSMIDMDYFHKFIDPPTKVNIDPIWVPPIPVIPVPVESDFPIPEDSVVKEVISPENPPVVSPQASIEESMEDEFADMKLVFPKSTHNEIEIPPVLEEDEFADMKLDSQIELNKLQFPEKKDEGFDCEDDEKATVLEVDKSDDKGAFGVSKENSEEKELEGDENGGGLNIWKMGMTGFGALCSFGFAFATICVIALGCRHRERQDQNLHFQIYSHEKRFKQVVHHAAKLNGAISVVRGDPLSRAHISIGGYFEGL